MTLGTWHQPVAIIAAVLLLSGAGAPAPTDRLPSWHDGQAKRAILTFIQAATNRSSPAFVQPKDRIATFDQDGTLWAEHPVYAQGMFAIDRVRALAPKHPEWRRTAPFAAILAGDQAAMAKLSEKDWAQVIAATHAGMTNDQFLAIVQQWLATAKHPRFRRPYTELSYQPMQEVLRLFRANDFKTYIVTGGGQEFVRAYAERVYGIPPEQVLGSSIATQYDHQAGRPVLMRLPKVAFIDDHAGKAIGINWFIGKRPSAAFGNSDGDREMLEWAGPGLKLLVLHDDATREYAYGPAEGLPATHVGGFSSGLMAEATSKQWTVVSMKKDWRTVFSFDAN